MAHDGLVESVERGSLLASLGAADPLIGELVDDVPSALARDALNSRR